jgi:hypothetical protein
MQPSLLALLPNFLTNVSPSPFAPNAHGFPHGILQYIYIYCAGPVAWWCSSCCGTFSWRPSYLARKMPVLLITVTPSTYVRLLHHTEPWIILMLHLCCWIVSTTTHVKYYYCRINCNSIAIQYALTLSPERSVKGTEEAKTNSNRIEITNKMRPCNRIYYSNVP